MKAILVKIIHSGFDSLYFAIQGALSGPAQQRFERLKGHAVKEQRDVPFSIANQSTRYQIKSTGKKGGYTYAINTGFAGSMIFFKSSLSRSDYNGFVEISSASLLANGWKAAVERALNHVKALGFHVVSLSMNRVDYCIDFLNARLEIDPRDFIAHSRVKKSCYYERPSVADHVNMRSEHVYVHTVSQSDQVKGITLGKMPGQQVIVYDKRAEVIEKRKLYWFKAWGIDRADNTCRVHRVEVRAGKKHLMNSRIRTLEDFEAHIGHVLKKAVRDIRWVKRRSTDGNVTRMPLHPVWVAVQSEIGRALVPYTAPITEEEITARIRANKALEYRQQTIGNLGGYLACKGTTYDDMPADIQAFVTDVASTLTSNTKHPLIKSYLRAKDRWNAKVN